jgi:hypothetical protein
MTFRRFPATAARLPELRRNRQGDVYRRARRCARLARSTPLLGLSTLRTSDNVNISNDLPNGPHLDIHYAIELLSSNTQLARGRAQTTLGAGESYLTCFRRQLSYLDANALSHFPALT